MEKIVVEAKCPYCRKSLMNFEKQIDGYPSDKLRFNTVTK